MISDWTKIKISYKSNALQYIFPFFGVRLFSKIKLQGVNDSVIYIPWAKLVSSCNFVNRRTPNTTTSNGHHECKIHKILVEWKYLGKGKRNPTESRHSFLLTAPGIPQQLWFVRPLYFLLQQKQKWQWNLRWNSSKLFFNKLKYFNFSNDFFCKNNISYLLSSWLVDTNLLVIITGATILSSVESLLSFLS